MRYTKKGLGSTNDHHVLHKGDTIKDALYNKQKEIKYYLSSLTPNSQNNCINLIPIHGSFDLIL